MIDRTASDTIKGYFYQFDLSILKLLELSNEFEEITIGGIEDIDVKMSNEEIKEFVLNQIEILKLDISEEKTEIVSFEEKIIGDKLRIQSSRVLKNITIENFLLSYLGFEFYDFQTLLKSKNLSSFYRKMKESVSIKSKRVQSIKKKKFY